MTGHHHHHHQMMIGIPVLFLVAILFVGMIGNAELLRNGYVLRQGGDRTLRAEEEEVSSTTSSSHVEKLMSSSSSSSSATTLTAATSLRQSTTTSAAVDLPYVVSLPSLSLIVGPLISLSSNTGALLSIANNAAIRMNTLSGLQYAIEYYLNNTSFTNYDVEDNNDDDHHLYDNYWQEFEYASIDSLDYIQNVAAPAVMTLLRIVVTIVVKIVIVIVKVMMVNILL